MCRRVSAASVPTALLIAEKRGCARLGDRVHRIEPQAVETEFAKPIKRILDGEPPHLRHL